MHDKEKIYEELRSKAADPNKVESLNELYLEVSDAYAKGSSRAVEALLKHKVHSLKDAFDASYQKLCEKMGM